MNGSLPPGGVAGGAPRRVPYARSLPTSRSGGSLGGSESACLGLGRALKARGHDVHFITTKQAEDAPDVDRWGVPWHRSQDLPAKLPLMDPDVFVALRSPHVFGLPVPALTIDQRVDRAERLLRGGVPKTAVDEAERIASEARDPSIVVRALRVVADGAHRLGRHEAAAKALALAIPRVASERQGAMRLEQARLLLRAGQRDRAFET